MYNASGCMIILITMKFRLMENSNAMFGYKKKPLSHTMMLCTAERQQLSEGINAKQKLDLTATHRRSFRPIRAAARHGVLLHLPV